MKGVSSYSDILDINVLPALWQQQFGECQTALTQQCLHIQSQVQKEAVVWVCGGNTWPACTDPWQPHQTPLGWSRTPNVSQDLSPNISAWPHSCSCGQKGRKFLQFLHQGLKILWREILDYSSVSMSTAWEWITISYGCNACVSKYCVYKHFVTQLAHSWFVTGLLDDRLVEFLVRCHRLLSQ